MLYFGTLTTARNMELLECNEEICEEPYLTLYQFNIYLFYIVGIHFMMHIVHNI
jgi:hypothetical protein